LTYPQRVMKTRTHTQTQMASVNEDCVLLQNYIYKLPARRTRESVSGISLSRHQPAWNALNQNQSAWRQNTGTTTQ